MKQYTNISLLGLGHLMVDFLSIYLVYTYTNEMVSMIAITFISYNAIAFALQPVFGYLADQYNLYRCYLVIGLLLPLIAVMTGTSNLIIIVIATLGNAMYHVGGGVISLHLFPGKAAPAGIFVAPGAIGVFLGVLLARNPQISSLIIIIPAFIILVSLYIVFGTGKETQVKHVVPVELGTLIILILLVVFIRGMIGFTISFPWKGETVLGFILVLGVFSGKFLGGILGDRFGYKRIGIGGLLLSVPFLLLGVIPAFGMIGALLFNFTMAITLFLIISMFGKYQGFAFGLTTFALFLSYLPNALGWYPESNFISSVLLVVLPLCAAVLLHIVITKYNVFKGELK